MFTLRPIGRIETPYRRLEECPSGTDPENGPDCWLVLDEAYAEGLAGLEVGQRILILYWFADVDRSAVVVPRRSDGRPAGVFSLRSPMRPNPIAAAILPVEEIQGNRVRVKGMDCLNGTPLVDIKQAARDITGSVDGTRAAGRRPPS